MDKPLIGLTMGDPAGIGPEICIKALVTDEVQKLARCVVIGDLSALRQAAKICKLSGIELNPIENIEQANFKPGIINLFNLKNVDTNKLKMGQVSKMAGTAAMEYLEKAVDLAMSGTIDAITTAPINKEAMHKAGYTFQGHTEFLADRTGTKNYAMMFVSPSFWLMLATTHLPLKEVSKHLDKKKLVFLMKLAHETLLKLRGKNPRIGVAGLNPHAGEAGIFGDEEEKIIRPAIEEAKKLNIDVKGPISADAIFYLAKSGMFDMIIAMYHDQGLIPLKLLSFNHSVNVTAGLPIIRTSVDHGTGFDIAGKGWANPQSLIEAIKVAAHFVKSEL